MVRKTLKQGDKYYGDSFFTDKYSQCLLSIRERMATKDLIEIHTPNLNSGEDLIIPTFNLVNVKKYNPVLHKYRKDVPQKNRLEALPEIRNSFSDNYFGGVSLAFVPGKVKLNSDYREVNIYPGEDDFKDGWEFIGDNGKKTIASFVFMPYLCDNLFIKENNQRKIVLDSSEVMEETNLSMMNSLRNFFTKPPVAGKKNSSGRITNFGFFRPKEGAFERYQSIINGLEKRFSQKIPRNQIGFQYQ